MLPESLGKVKRREAPHKESDRMERTTTLRKFIGTGQVRTAVVSDRIAKDFDELTDIQKRMALQRTINETVRIEMACRAGKLFVNEITERITRVGRKIFRKRTRRNLVFCEGNTLKIKCQFPETYLDHILPLFGVEWARDMKDGLKHFLMKPSILKAVITGRVYSEETFVKRIASQVYRVKGVEWKVLRDFLVKMPYSFSLYDLNVFTKNLNHSLKAVLAVDYSRGDVAYQRLHLMKDTLANAILLDRVIDLRWSDRRMQQEHQQMCREIGLMSAGSKSTEPIHPQTVGEEHIRMLNSEMEVFLEGISMSHCLYTNYFSGIRDKRYLAFHMSSPEDCTIGVRIGSDGNPCLDQAYRYRNQRCSEETYQLIREFIDRKSAEIGALMSQERSTRYVDLMF